MAAEPAPQLKLLLECLPILVVRGVFNGDGVFTLADFVALLHFALPLILYIFRLWGEGGSEMYFAMSSCSQQHV
jgi:hypothetical protein